MRRMVEEGLQAPHGIVDLAEARILNNMTILMNLTRLLESGNAKNQMASLAGVATYCGRDRLEYLLKKKPTG